MNKEEYESIIESKDRTIALKDATIEQLQAYIEMLETKKPSTTVGVEDGKQSITFSDDEHKTTAQLREGEVFITSDLPIKTN